MREAGEPAGLEVEDVVSARPGRAERVAAAVLVLVVALAWGVKVRGVSFGSTAPEQATQEEAMKAGLDALYSRNDPAAAIARFRRVLALHPAHYGATYQLATALDRAGETAEARATWERMLPMALAANDDATAAAVRARLESPATAEQRQAEAMKAGLDALAAQGDPAAAIAQFRKVLELNPSHYGATYQLAVALDRAGRRSESTPLWEKVLVLAGTYRDEATAKTARERLDRKP